MSDKRTGPVSVIYKKFYTDDTGKHISDTFSDLSVNHVNVKHLWESTVDGFYSTDHTNYFTCLAGDLRIVIANEADNAYKFNQYFISDFDGKIIKIKPYTWFAVHNLGSDSAVIMNGTDSIGSVNRLSSKIFDWHSKR